MTKKTLLLASGFWLLASDGFSQQLPLSNQYTINKFFLSPAYAGTGDVFEVFGSYRNDWADIPGAPELKIVSANGLVCKNMGLGATISSQKAGIFENLSASVSYAYHLKFGGVHNLSFGLGAGLLESRVNLAGTAGQTNDPVAWNNADVSSMVPDAGFGILYRNKTLHIGISIPRLLGSKIKNDNGGDVYSLSMHQQFSMGYKYSINNDWAVDPLAKILLTNNAPLFYEAAVPVLYKNKIWLTPVYKKTSMAVGIGGIPYHNFIVNYFYEFSSTGIMGQSGGTHEIIIGWKMPAKKKSDAPAPDSKKPYYEWLNK